MSYIDKSMGRGESPITITRRHIIVLIGYAFKWFGLFLISFVLALWLAANWHDAGSTVISDNTTNTLKTVVVLALFALALVAIIAMIANYIRWYNEIYVLTNRRVIRIQGIFNKDETDSSLDKLNDTKEHQSFWGRLLGYGSVEILTAAQEGIDQLDYVPNPMQFRKAIQDAKNGYYNQAANVVGQGQNGALNTGVYDQANLNNYQQRPVQNNQAGRHQNVQPQPSLNNYQPPITTPLDGANSNGQIKPHDVPGLIQQLAKLRDAGVITEAEFQAKKNDLFSRM